MTGTDLDARADRVDRKLMIDDALRELTAEAQVPGRRCVSRRTLIAVGLV
jgi:hypothetical protein